MTAVAQQPLRRHDLESVVRGEFNEMPGMRLTVAQACRLWSLCRDDCERILGKLVRAGFLTRDASDRYCRRTDCPAW